MALYSLISLVVLAYLTWWIFSCVRNVYFHPLSTYPGPTIAAATRLYKAYVEVIAQISWVDTLEALHATYGDVVRTGPNELHFINPEIYHEIYNLNNRWNKEESLYHSFGEDRSSFGYLTYAEAKPRKDILTRVFSKKAIRDAGYLVQEKVTELCNSFIQKNGSPIDLFYAFRCMSIDVITHLCFGSSVNALKVPDYRASIILAMDASAPVFVRFKHSSLYKNMIVGCPPNIARVVAPETAGLINLQETLRNQVIDLTTNPEHLKTLPHSTTIWNELLRPELHPDGKIPPVESLFEESQALMFGGADTTGTTLMHGSFEMLQRPDVVKKLKDELEEAWPNVNRNPTQAELEALPYLTAVIKESLRMSPGVESPLPRVVPDSGATLGGRFVPGESIVGISSRFVHRSKKVFPNPERFDPERWLGASGKELERWLISFSRGPRSCVGLNLAWCELYLTFAHVYRKFDIEVDPSSPKKLVWRDCFLPEYHGPHLKASLHPVKGVVQ